MAERRKTTSAARPSLLRRGYLLWERSAATSLEAMVRSPLFSRANSAWLGSLLMTKQMTDAALRAFFSSLGLATSRDQERALHLLQRLQDRMDDLELKLAEERSNDATPPH